MKTYSGCGFYKQQRKINVKNSLRKILILQSIAENLNIIIFLHKIKFEFFLANEY